MTGLELDDAIDLVVARAGASEHLEAYGLARDVFTVQAGMGGEVTAVGRAQTRGLGVRAVAADRMGYASTSDLSVRGLTQCLERARQHSRIATASEGERLPSTAGDIDSEPGAFDLVASALDTKLALVGDLARRVVSLDRRVRRLDVATYREERVAVHIGSTLGISAQHERGFAQLSVDVVGEDGHRVAADGDQCVFRRPADCDVEMLAGSAVTRTTRLLGTPSDPTVDAPVLFDPDVSAIFLVTVGRWLTGPAIMRGRGPFADALGRAVAAACVTLVDDGLDDRAPAGAPFDDEGVARQHTVLIDQGTAVGVLHSTGSAALAHTKASSTGNARRGSHKSPPVVAPTTVRMAATDLPAAVGEHPAIMCVQQVSGGLSGVSGATGRVEVGATGYMLRRGEVAGSFANAPLSTSVQDVLGHALAVGDEAVAVEGLPTLAPSLLCAGSIRRGSRS